MKLNFMCFSFWKPLKSLAKLSVDQWFLVFWKEVFVNVFRNLIKVPDPFPQKNVYIHSILHLIFKGSQIP